MVIKGSHKYLFYVFSSHDSFPATSTYPVQVTRKLNNSLVSGLEETFNNEYYEKFTVCQKVKTKSS